MNATDGESQVHDFYYKLHEYQKEFLERVLGLDYIAQREMNQTRLWMRGKMVWEY